MTLSPSPGPVPESTSPCPCGSGQSYGSCCEPILSGQKPASTAEALMRARFTAHVLHHFEFLHRSYLPTSATPYVEEKDPPSVNWTRLVIHSHEPGPKADVAYVDFSAYHDDGTEHAGAHHEKAEFMLRHGGWIYSRPVREGAAPIRLAQPKPGRNDPCPCGSGKKYKHCCLNRPEVRKIAG